MGTKKPSWTLFDTLSAHISSDRSHRPGRKSRDPSPRPGATAPTERERTREEEWREREMDRLKQDKARSKRKDTDPRERYPERERAPSPRARRGERDRRDREGRQEAETRPNGRPVSHFETRGLDREAERARNKGDTFPRMRRDDDHRDRRRDQFGEKDAARGDRRPMERQQRTATDDLERESERRLRRERQGDGERYKERDGDKNIGRPIDDRTVRQRDRPRETDPGSRERRRERDPEVNDPCNRKEKDLVRDRDRLQPNMGERQGPRGASPRRRPERDPNSDDERQERAKGRVEKRGTRSEGNSDEEMSKKTQRERADRNERRPRHSRSEGDDKGRVARERDGDGQRYREEERQRDGGRDTGRRVRQEEGRDRDRNGGKEREGERRRDGEREAKGARNDGRQKERERYRDGEGEERRRRNERSEREADPRRVRAAGRGSHGGGPPQAQSSGEWSSDVDSDRQRQRVREDDRESGRESTADSEREAKEKGGSASAERGVGGGTERGHEERQRGGRHDGERLEERTRQRKMWLEPRRGKYSQGSSLEDEVGEERTESGTGRGREGHRVKEELDERYSDPRAPRVTYLEQREREEEGVSVDGEEVREAWAGKDRGRVEGRRLGDEGGSCDSSEWSGSEGGSRTDGERDKMLSGEDGFVTASSGGDEEDERLYRDSRESWEGEDSKSGHKGHGGEREAQEGWREESEDRVHGEGDCREGDRQVTEKKPTIVFCVIGQTLPRSDRPSKSSDLSVDTRQSSSGSSVCGDNITHQRHSDSPPIPSRIDQRPVININPDQESEAERQGDNRGVLNEARAYTDDTSRVIRYTTEPKESETGGGAKSKVEHPYAEIGPIRKNSETEKLLAAWRERETLLTDQTEKEGGSLASPIDPYDEVGYQGDSAPVSAPSDENGPINMCPEEKEVAIRIRMSGAWSLAEEAKRHSQAPHLKWAKNVVFEILGSSEEHAVVDDPQPGSQEGQEVNQPDEMPEGEQQQEEQEQEEEEMVGEGAGEMPVYATVQKQKAGNQNSGTELSEGEGEAEPQEMEELRDGEDCRSDSWGEVDLRNVLDTIGRRKRNSKFFNVGPLYQQYSDNAQNIEILRQARSDTISIPVPSSSSPPSSPTSSSPTSSSPTSSPPPARRPLPPLPPVPHPHSLSHTGSITSIKSLPLPELPASHGRRSSSPRLSIAPNTQTLWQDLPGVRNSTELGEFTEDQRRLQEVRFEVVTSEASYCRSLDIVVDNFVKSKQLGALLTTQDRNWLFSRLADVRAISHSFLSKLEERVETNTMHFSVCDIIARHCKRFGAVYVPYLTNQSYQDATYQRLMNENLKFKQVVEKLERSPICQRLPLRSFLILPFQRITRIKLLVQNIVKRTAPATEEVVQAIKALRMLEKLIQESNDSITQMKSIESLVSLSAKVDFECRTLPLVSQSRRLVREGPVTELMDFSLKETERTVYLHLFNDYLLLSLHKEGGRFTVIDHSPVSDLRAENCRVKLHSLQKNLFRLHLSNKALLLRTDTQSDKLRWISAVSRPHPEIDFSSAQDSKQMQCIRAIVAHQPDELSLEKADIILVHQQSSDGWVEGTRLSDRHRGWMPESHLETITNSKVQERNLSDALKLTTATAAV